MNTQRFGLNTDLLYIAYTGSSGKQKKQIVTKAIKKALQGDLIEIEHTHHTVQPSGWLLKQLI